MSAPDFRLLTIAGAADRRLLHSMRNAPHGAPTDRAAAALSLVADHSRCWIATAALGAVVDRSHAGAFLTGGAAVVATERLSKLIKTRIRRLRPDVAALAPVTTRYSCPSSHTATAATAVVVFGNLLPRRALLAWALVTGLSRPYLGVHYPSDVLAGALLGALTGRLAVRSPIRRSAGG